MRLSSLAKSGLVTIILVRPPCVTGQEVFRGDPNKLRDPTMLSLPATEATRGPVQLLVQELLQAVRDRDAATLRRLNVSDLGMEPTVCAPLQQHTVTDRGREAPPRRVLRPRVVQEITMTWGDIDVSPGTGDTVAIATVELSQRGSQGISTRLVTLVVMPDNGAMRIARVDSPSPLAANCGSANP